MYYIKQSIYLYISHANHPGLPHLGCEMVCASKPDGHRAEDVVVVMFGELFSGSPQLSASAISASISAGMNPGFKALFAVDSKTPWMPSGIFARFNSSDLNPALLFEAATCTDFRFRSEDQSTSSSVASSRSHDGRLRGIQSMSKPQVMFDRHFSTRPQRPRRNGQLLSC